MKPPYKVPSMKEIAEIPWNGYNVVSTFSGGGGSCLGYRMAGYRVLYANEFVDEAQRTYKANHPKSHLDPRDIRRVTADDIRAIIGNAEIDIFDGSPPCAAFSTAGLKHKGWGKVKDYSDTRQRVDDLFFEYTRLLRDLQPKVFVAENVSGLIKGTAKGYFKLIIKELKECGYNVSVKLLNGKWLGIPQARERLIFIGVRNDLSISPVHPKPLPYYYTVSDALKGLDIDREERIMLLNTFKRTKMGEVLRKIEKNPKKPITGQRVTGGSYFNLRRESMYQACGTITATGGTGAGNCHPIEDRPFTIGEVKRLCSFPDDFILTGNRSQQWERAGRSVPPIMMMRVAKTIEEEVLNKIGTNI